MMNHLSYYELLSKVIAYLNQVIDQTNETLDYIEYLKTDNDGNIQQLRLDYESFEQKTLQDIALYKQETLSVVNALKLDLEDAKDWIETEALPS